MNGRTLYNNFDLTVLIIAILMMALTTLYGKENGELMAPTNLRCEYKIDPLGIDVEIPRFSWHVNDSQRSAVQSAYQILVASSEELLSLDKSDIWNSGKVETDQSVNVNYSGPKLESRKTYYWKIRTWNKNGDTSPFSKTANWEMGILSEDEWKASWIGNEIIADPKEEENKWQWKEWFWHPTEIGIHVPVFFRKNISFPHDKKITSALVRMTADNNFTLYINNEKIGSGESWQKIYDFDVSDKIKDKNLIAIEAANTAGNICALLFSIKINFEDGSEVYIGADKNTMDWRTTNIKYPDWQMTAFDDSEWGDIKLLGDYETGSFEKVDDQDQYTAPRPILVRNEISINKNVKRARAYVTGLGGYVMHINGERVGDAVFTPGWTHYPKRIQYQTFDIGSMLQKGKNALGAILGNLWWSSGLGWRGSNTYSKGPLRFFMQLVVDYQDGSSQTFITDKNWKTHDAPIVETTLYNGEYYDARLEQKGWSKINFDDSGWETVTILEKEKGNLVAQQGPLLRITKELKPINISSPSEGVYIFDMGQNFAGWAKLKVEGERGDSIQLRFAETLQPDGNIYTENLREAKATDNYVLKGEGLEEWQPNFTYHGFRYVEVTGFPGVPTTDALTGLVVNSDAPMAGQFSCSNEMLNKVQHNILWGQASNMYSVPTDCPQRDERLGWMGDAQAFAPTSSYNMDMISFYSKWMKDITDSQDDDGAVHDVNPVIVVTGPAAPGWGDAVFVVPWVMYKFYGDKRILEESYDAMAAWIDYMTSKSEGNLYEKSGYGDWVAPEKSPSEPIGSAYYFYGAKIVSEIAGILGKREDEKRYRELSQKIAAAYNEKHFDPVKNTYTGDTQTANLLPLNFGIVPEENRAKVAATIADNVIAKGNHHSTGFLGVPLILPTLSNYGYHELAYKVASQKTYPSWGYMVEKGATTIWELWNSDTEGPGMNSRNHFALGSCGEWYYGYLAGIQANIDNPGFKHFTIAPKPYGDLTWVESTYNSIYGEIRSRWDKNEDRLSLEITIPTNTTASLYVPVVGRDNPEIFESGKLLFKDGKSSVENSNIKFIEKNNEAAHFEVGSGTYSIEVR